MKILIAPDSFKGSLTAREAIDLLTQAAKKIFPECETVSVPMADGGEGTMEILVDVFHGKIESMAVSDPLGYEIQAEYAVLNENTVMIEMAKASGLPLVPVDLRNPLKTSTYGTGELIKNALVNGYHHIILSIGGSATNDGGIGAAAALGVKFLDENGLELPAIGESLSDIHSIDETNIIPEMSCADVTIICDVTNPLIGENGATYVYGPQKGATQAQLLDLENGMKNYADVIFKQFGKDFSDMKGAGAAGGLSIPFLLFANAKLAPGIDTIFDAISFEERLDGVDLVVTGEGQVDWQSAFGKVLSGVGQAAKKRNIPCVAIVGSMGKDFSNIYECGIDSIMPIVNKPMTLEYAMKNSKELFLDAAERMFRLIKIGRK